MVNYEAILDLFKDCIFEELCEVQNEMNKEEET